MSRRATIIIQALRARQTAPIPLAAPTTTSYRYAQARPLDARGLHSSIPILARPGPSSHARDRPPANPLGARDHDIPFPHVQLVDPVTNSLGPSVSLDQVLASYDLATHSLVVVSAEPPIVRVIDREAERHKQRAAEARFKLNRKTNIENKEIQISWNSAQGDVQHKANVARGILEKGDRVDLVFAAKKRAEAVDDQRKEEMVAMFDEVLGDVGRRWKDDERNKGVRICFWEPKSAVREAVRDRVMKGEIGKRKDKDEKKEARRRKEEERMRRAASRAADH